MCKILFVIWYHLCKIEKNVYKKVRELKLPRFKTYYKTIIIKTVWHLHKDINT